MDVGKEYMQRVDVTEGDAWDIERWRQREREQPNEEEDPMRCQDEEKYHFHRKHEAGGQCLVCGALNDLQTSQLAKPGCFGSMVPWLLARSRICSKNSSLPATS